MTMFKTLAVGGQSLTIALGGHPPPVLRREDGAVTEIGEPGSLLGIFEPMLTDTNVAVAPGDSTLTRMPVPFRSSAQLRARLRTAALLAL